MREIKFRAWDKEENKMAIVDSINFNINGTDTFVSVTVAEPLVIDGVSIGTPKKLGDKVELMQYTGLKNHKGTEIYEGDIIHARGHYPGEGWYDTGEHEYNFKDEVKWDKEKLAYTCGGYYLHELNIIKIIGNKYQNPELRKEVESNE